jgi:hypothetical protein
MSLRDHLEEIRAEHGRLDPAIVVDAARPEDHPLHDRFEWDDSVAGESWRRVQAHRLIQAVKIIDLRTDDAPRHLRAYVAIPQPDGRPDYQPLEDVAHDDFTSRLLLQEAEREWRQLSKRYAHLSEFIAMVRADVEDMAAAG